MMINTHFEKVQIRPSESVGVITVFSQDMTCPSRGCEPIVFDNWSVKFMNYGYNISSELSLSNFLYFSAHMIPLIITNTSFEYNIVLSSAVLYFTKIK